MAAACPSPVLMAIGKVRARATLLEQVLAIGDKDINSLFED
ncbi:MAG: hypothetical protein WBC72_03665 [Pseudolabrys sp.]